jgi:glycosyltransferase involved in cell wall biosynthesis
MKKALIVANNGFALYNYRFAFVKHLMRCGWNVIVAANDEANFQEKFAFHGITFINVSINHKGLNPLTDLALVMKLKKLYKQESPDIVHHFTIKPVIFGTLAGKLARIPSIVNTITGLGYVFVKGGLIQYLVMLLYKLAFMGKAHVILQNNDDYKLFITSGIVKKKKAHIILGSGINTQEIYPQKRNRKDEKGLRFLFFSRMLWDKGVKEYVEAAEKVKRQYGETIFYMAGGHTGAAKSSSVDAVKVNNPQAIKEQWLHGVNDRGYVKWIGRVSFEEILRLLDNSDVVVLPSYREGLARALTEASAKGKPIITTDVPGCREVVVNGVNGFLVPLKDVDALADAMMKFIHYPALIESMGQASRERAVELFDEKKIFTQILEVYKKAGVML